MKLPALSNEIDLIDESEAPVQVQVNFMGEKGFYRIVQEFTKSKYALTPTEIKTWFIFLSKMKEFRNQTNIVYTIDPKEIADILELSTRRARNKVVIDAFRSLAKKSIEIENKGIQNKYGEHPLFVANFFSTVFYDIHSRQLYIRMSPELHHILFNFAKDIESVGIDLKDIISLKRTASIRIFIALKNLAERGINAMSIDDLKDILDNHTYAYKDMKRYILKPAIADIRENTSFKEFNITDDHKNGTKASTIFFEMKDLTKEKKEIAAERYSLMETFKDAPPSVKSRLKKLRNDTLDKLALAIFSGFDKNYLPKIPLEKEGQVTENILSALDYIHKKTKFENKTFSADERGRLIYSAIIKNKAKVADTSSVKPDEDNIFVLRSETDTSTLEAMYVAAARKYVKSLSNNEYMNFAVNNRDHIRAIFHKELVLNDLLKRDARKAAYKLLVKYVVLLATKNQLDIGLTVK